MLTIKLSGLKLAFISCLVFSFTALAFSTTYETKALKFNSDYSEILEGRDMKFFSVQIGQHSGKEDLLIDTQIIGNSEKSQNNLVSPLILVSLVGLKILILTFRTLFRTMIKHRLFCVEN
jgi:hypothetical protein